MEIYLKKYFWVVNLVAIALCAGLAAKGVSHLIEAKYLLGDPNKKPVRPRPKAPVAPIAPVGDKKDDALVATRNVFCLTCEPPKPVDATPQPQVAYDPLHPPATTLPLQLLATHVNKGRASLSAATVLNTGNNKVGSYWIGDRIPGVGEVEDIRPRWIDFHNDSLNRTERLDVLGAAAPQPAVAVAPPPGVPPPAVASNDPEAQLQAEIDKGVRKIDDSHYEVDRALVDKILTDPTAIARSARIVPSIKDGKANGFKMYAIRPNSVYAKIGMQNGDTINSINGYEITTPDRALEVYTKVKSASSLSVQVTRRGQPVNMEYTIK
jgi:general secretion pathway protein C